MKLRPLIIFLFTFGTVGCSNNSELIAVQTSANELTAEQAKVALIELLQTTELDDIPHFPIGKFANDPVEIRNNTTASWAGFHFDLKGRKYSYSIERGEPNTKLYYVAAYEGEFQWKERKWFATKPHVTFQS